MIIEELELLPVSEPERRRAPRPAPPPPNLAPRMRRFVDWLVEFMERGWAARLVFGLVSAVCIGFIYWNLNIRLERLDHIHGRVVEHAMLQQEFDELAEHYSRDELQVLLEQITSAESSVFSDYADLAAWLTAQSSEAERLQLRLSYVMHETVPAQIKNVGEVPISLKVVPMEGHDADTYIRVLSLLRNLVDTRWHLEITDASILSDGQSIVSLDSTVHVWVDMP